MSGPHRTSLTTDLQRAIYDAVEVLRGGGLVAFPTDTLYGLGADVLSLEAVGRVFLAKGRASGSGLPVLVSCVSDLDLVVAWVPDVAARLMEGFWPGGLTLVLKRAPGLPRLVSGGGDTVAVRMPDHPVPLELIERLGRPITGTSANPSGGPDPVSADRVRDLLGNKVDYIIDAGSAPGGIPSTVLDLSAQEPRVLRRGAVPVEELRTFCPGLREPGVAEA